MNRFTAALLIAGAASLLGCKTESYCFADCDGLAPDGAGGSAAQDGGAATGGVLFGGTGGTNGGTAGTLFGGSGGGCTDTNGGEEICDQIDNDCDGKTDESEGSPSDSFIDFTRAATCGTCDNNCITKFGEHVELQGCDPPATPDGTTEGTCLVACEQDYYDINNDKETDGCEYYCQWNPTGANTTDPGGVTGCLKDDDCDGTVDEDLNTCGDVDNCGKCGRKCFIANGTAKCESTVTSNCSCGTACGLAGTPNTDCAVEACDPGFENPDGAWENGCEYQCTKTTNPNEICDGVDNDCDGLIDNADPDLETQDPTVGDTCFGGASGECADSAHAGVSKCIGVSTKCCDTDSNNVNGTNPKFPVTGVRNGECDGNVGPFVIVPDEISETCNAKDDDCDALIDDNTTDSGGSCGSSVGNCAAGTEQCCLAGSAVPECAGKTGTLVCVGFVGTQPELCNGQDDNCDGVIDGCTPGSASCSLTTGAPAACTTSGDCPSGQICLPRAGPSDKVCAAGPTDAVGACDVPPPPPAGATSPCQAGTLACVGGQRTCSGSITRPISTPDGCGIDANCDGALTGQPSTDSDVKNCGSCGNDCTALAPGGHGIWACNTGVCQRIGCDPGFIHCDGNANDCERACTFVSPQEQCNGADDDCDCSVDEGVVTPTPPQVCGVSPAASEAACTTGVTIACTSGAWRCTFPAGYCDGGTPASCSATADVCDAKDNNCNGNTDENFKPPVLNQGYLTQPCASDDGLPAPGHGACRTTGTYVCNGLNATQCNAVKNNGAAGAELCDGQDNDCDGSVDEPHTTSQAYPAGKGTNTTFWVKPAVTQIAAALWISQYETSRPGATNINPGTGNGYYCTTGCPGGIPAAPGGVTLDKTNACSVPNVVPWFNVTGVEAEQTCNARGGRLCTLADWQTACRATAACTRGYSPRTGGPPPACQQNGTYPAGTRVCNIGPFDFDQNAGNGNQDGLLPTASGLLSNCFSDWAGLQGNPAAFDDIRDIEGNLREITDNGAVYTLMGGAFNSQSEDGASCDFTFYNVNASFKLFDVGYRCCYTTKPD